METKNIFKTLALAMLMPTMLLITACSSEDDVVNSNIANIETVANKGYALPVTVNVTREGDATMRASYNGTSRKLEFTTGDKLFVEGWKSGPGQFAGTLTWVSGTTFTGTITTGNEYTGTADELFSGASPVSATLLPADYGTYSYLSIWGTYEHSKTIKINKNKPFATLKATAVEQFSKEQATSYSSGFALSPQNAILNFTIIGLTASTDVDVALTGPSSLNITGSVTTDVSGNATFAVGVEGGTDLNDLSLTVAGNAITLVSSSKPLEAGHVYNISRSAAPAASKALSEVTSSEKGWRIGSDGTVYEPTGALPTGVTAVAAIAYVGSETGDATYNHGLAIALADEGSMDQSTALSTCSDKNTSVTISNASWMLPSKDQWGTMCNANGGYSSKWTGLNTIITSAQGTGLLTDLYWTSYSYTVGSAHYGDCFDIRDNGDRFFTAKDQSSTHYVRAVLAF